LITLLIKEVGKINDVIDNIETEKNNIFDINYLQEQANEIREYLKEQTYKISARKKEDKIVEEARRETIDLKSAVEGLKTKMVDLEFKNNKLMFIVEDLESEKKEREAINLSKEQKRIKELERDLKVMEKQTERFEMMDL
jgi:hypothetical protein